MAQVAQAALAIAPSVWHGLTQEYDELKKDPETNRLKRVGQLLCLQICKFPPFVNMITL